MVGRASAAVGAFVLVNLLVDLVQPLIDPRRITGLSKSQTSVMVKELELTAFGRSYSGTIRGERAVSDRYLNHFFSI